jgi:hypothetical protein
LRFFENASSPRLRSLAITLNHRRDSLAHTLPSGGLTDANFITGLPTPSGIAFLDNTLYVTVNSGGFSGVRTYKATSGELIDPDFLTNLDRPYGLAIKPAP